jgi:DNA-binding NtrC family response regulator
MALIAARPVPIELPKFVRQALFVSGQSRYIRSVEPPFSLAVVVDDDPDIALAARLALRDLFERVETLSTPAELLPLLKTKSPDAILLDLNFERGATDGREGLSFLGQVMKLDPDASVVIITAHGAVSVAVEALKAGASDFVAKPWSNERLAATVRSAAALRRSRIDARTERGRASELVPSADTPLLGGSNAMQRVRSLIERAAPTDANVLILGENGTGKELVARAIHRLSRCAGEVFLRVDMGALSPQLFESELFGHRRGAFTDAKQDRTGFFRAATGGTLFLDEIGNVPLHLQAKLLTALERREVVPVGAEKPEPIDVRLICATNLGQERLADENLFRQDLLYRINTVEITLPPLRERQEDIPLLLSHYAALYAQKYNLAPKRLSAALIDRLTAWPWPGNVRALRHAVERAVILSDGELLGPGDFPVAETERDAPQQAGTDVSRLDAVEKAAIVRALERHKNNVSRAAEALGLTRTSLYRRMEKYGL